MPYDDSSEKSIFKYAKRLEGKTFKDAIEIGQESFKVSNDIIKEETSGYLQNISSKGSSGHLLEKYYFGYDLNNDDEPDFNKVGMELKIAPLKINSKKQLSSKERMVISIINYEKVINEEFMSSHLYKKANKILMIFYVHDLAKDKLDYKITNVYKYIIPNEDLPVIERDYNTIINKIKEGKAHELSEADTLFLGASTKGANKSSLRDQPNSETSAMQRAFSLKSSYVNFIYNNYVLPQKRKEEEIIKNYHELEKISFEELTENKLKPFIGMTEMEIRKHFGLDGRGSPKNIFSILTYRMLGIKGNSAAEFIKANISVKTIRINKTNRINESMSFKNFKFMDIVNQDWEDSELKEMFEETKFLFVVYKMNEDNEYVLMGSQYWNIPMPHLENDVKSVWEQTKIVVTEGIIVRKVGKLNVSNLPGSADNNVCHVRPHARNKMDTYPTPNGCEYTKQSFWLNSNYVLSQLKRELIDK